MLESPPAPLQINENVVVALMAPVFSLPLIALDPPQPPEAEQAVALVDVQVSVEESPVVMTDGTTVRVAVGTTFTATVVVGLVPPAPLQLNEYTAFAVSGPTDWLPAELSGPVQPPDATHAVAFVEVHVNVEEFPPSTIAGFAESIVVGTTFTVTLAVRPVPPTPLQVTEYTVFDVSGPTDRLPPVPSVPLQPPEAMQAVALPEFHVSVDQPPLLTTEGDALIDVVGLGWGC